MKYRIKWISKITEATGFGTGLFSKEQAEQIARDLNNQHNAICDHWASPYDSEGKPNQEKEK